MSDKKLGFIGLGNMAVATLLTYLTFYMYAYIHVCMGVGGD